MIEGNLFHHFLETVAVSVYRDDLSPVYCVSAEIPTSLCLCTAVCCLPIKVLYNSSSHRVVRRSPRGQTHFCDRGVVGDARVQRFDNRCITMFQERQGSFPL
jgi:hypothetical protein